MTKPMPVRLLLLLAALSTLLLLLAMPATAMPLAAAATPGPDPYEPDENNPPWIGDDESQNRSFYPDADVDKARFRVKGGNWYDIHTYGLGDLVDTSMTVEVAGILYKDDDGGPENLSSRVIFQSPQDCDAIITVINRQEVYGPDQVYKLYAGQTDAPTPTPTQTEPATATPKPTAQPGKPVINFSATPDSLDRPGDCSTLRWRVDRASEVYLVQPNGNREGVIGEGERQVCPDKTSTYQLEVKAPGGDETVKVTISVAPPTPTPTPAPTATPKPAGGSSGAGGSGEPGAIPTGVHGNLHVVVFTDENRSEAYDPPSEGVAGATVYLVSQTDPGNLQAQVTDELGQVHFAAVSGAYTVLIQHLGYAQSVAFRGNELTVNVLVTALRLPSRIP